MKFAQYVLAGLALTAACDAQDQAAATAATAPAKSGDAPARTDAPTKSGAGATAAAGPADAASDTPKFSGLSDCLRSCEVADVIPTNRETCRLNCDTAYGAQAPAGAGGANTDPVGQAASCMGRCYAADASGDGCATSCKDVASKASSPPSADTLDRLGTCIRTCHADKSVLPTNRATCELNCSQAARVAGPAQPTGATAKR